jgi:hypothetical protein
MIKQKNCNFLIRGHFADRKFTIPNKNSSVVQQIKFQALNRNTSFSPSVDKSLLSREASFILLSARPTSRLTMDSTSLILARACGTRIRSGWFSGAFSSAGLSSSRYRPNRVVGRARNDSSCNFLNSEDFSADCVKKPVPSRTP